MVWGQGQIALGDEVHGGGPWQGKIRLAQVRTAGHVVDYVRPGALSIPKSYFYFPDHVLPFPPTGKQQWMDVLLDMVSFIPVGFLIVWARRPPVRPVLATVLAAVLAVVLGGREVPLPRTAHVGGLHRSGDLWSIARGVAGLPVGARQKGECVGAENVIRMR